jgi:hypothetical protein
MPGYQDITWDTPVPSDSQTPTAPQFSPDDVKWDAPSPQGAFSYPNIVTGAKRGVAGIAGFPQFAAHGLGDVAHGFGLSTPELDWLSSHLPTSQQALSTFADTGNRVRQSVFGSSATPLYEPQTPGERIVQAGVAGAVPASATLPLLAAAGAPVAAAALPQLMGGMAGPATSQALAETGSPYWAQLAAGLAAALLGGYAGTGINKAAGAAGRFAAPGLGVGSQAAANVRNYAGDTPIEQVLPTFDPAKLGTLPTSQAVEPGLFAKTAGKLTGLGVGGAVGHAASSLGLPPGIAELGGGYLGVESLGPAVTRALADRGATWGQNVETMTQRALQDPLFAQWLLSRYQPHFQSAVPAWLSPGALSIATQQPQRQ